MTLQRRTPLKPGKPLERRTPLRSGGQGLARGKGLAAQSKQRKSEGGANGQRKATVRAVADEDGERCQLDWMGGCRGVLVGHEFTHRSVAPGAHLDPERVILLCINHNQWEDVQTNTIAEDAGVRASAWTVDRYGVLRVRTELARIREGRSRGADPGPPFWRN